MMVDFLVITNMKEAIALTCMLLLLARALLAHALLAHALLAHALLAMTRSKIWRCCITVLHR